LSSYVQRNGVFQPLWLRTSSSSSSGFQWPALLHHLTLCPGVRNLCSYRNSIIGKQRDLVRPEDELRCLAPLPLSFPSHAPTVGGVVGCRCGRAARHVYALPFNLCCMSTAWSGRTLFEDRVRDFARTRGIYPFQYGYAEGKRIE
jgi:hypothetical protein